MVVLNASEHNVLPLALQVPWDNIEQSSEMEWITSRLLERNMNAEAVTNNPQAINKLTLQTNGGYFQDSSFIPQGNN